MLLLACLREADTVLSQLSVPSVTRRAAAGALLSATQPYIRFELGRRGSQPLRVANLSYAACAQNATQETAVYRFVLRPLRQLAVMRR
jgi:hypothetical protein